MGSTNRTYLPDRYCLPIEVEDYFCKRSCPICQAHLEHTEYDEWEGEFHCTAYCSVFIEHFSLGVGWTDPKLDLQETYLEFSFVHQNVSYVIISPAHDGFLPLSQQSEMIECDIERPDESKHTFEFKREYLDLTNFDAAEWAKKIETILLLQ